MTLEQIYANRPLLALQSLLTFCEDSGISKPTMLQIIGLYDRLVTDMQKTQGAVRIAGVTSVTIAKRVNCSVFPVVIV